MVANLEKISDPKRVARNFAKYKGSDNAQLSASEKADKKYKVVFNGNNASSRRSKRYRVGSG
jgi:hypothetical protein